MARKIIHDLTGERFGRLTALEVHFSYHDRYRRWVCRCDCGKVKKIKTSDLTRGKTQSCGCLRRQVQSERVREPRRWGED